MRQKKIEQLTVEVPVVQSDRRRRMRQEAYAESVRQENRGTARKPRKPVCCILLASALSVQAFSSSEAATCYQYAVNIQGVVGGKFGDQQVLVTQLAVIRDSGLRNNPFEFVLTTQRDLNASAQVGDIELTTNSAFAGNPGIASAQFDLAQATLRQDPQAIVFIFQLDSGMSFQQPAPNVFVASGASASQGGLGGVCFVPGLAGLCQDLGNVTPLQLTYLVPRNGYGYFYFPDSRGATIAGEINVSGSALDNSNLQGRYQARFDGRSIGNAFCN